MKHKQNDAPFIRCYYGNFQVALFNHLLICVLLNQVLERFFNVVEINVENNEGNTPIHLASQQGHLEAVNILLKKAEVGITNKQGETVLHTCAKCTDESAAEVAGQ